MQFTALISNKQVHRTTGCLWVFDGFEKSPHAGLKPSSCGGGGWTWKRPGGGGLDTDSSGAISLSALLEEFQSPHYHFIWFHSTHLSSSSHTRMDHIPGLWTLQECYPRTYYFPFWKKRKPFVFAQAQQHSARTQASKFHSVFYQNPHREASSSTELRVSLSDSFPRRVKWKHLGTTINDLSSQTGKSTCGFNAGNIY